MAKSDNRPLCRIDESTLAGFCGIESQKLDLLCSSREDEYSVRFQETDSKRRKLSVPSRRLKLVQKRLLRAVFQRIKAHPCTACVRGRGTHWAYRRHVGHPALLRLDIRDFYPSVHERQVHDAMLRLGAAREVARKLTLLVTLEQELPQGAPTSVAVGDLVLFPLDVRLSGLAKQRGLTYTRYIDDLTLSGGEHRLRQAETLARTIPEALGWRLNAKGGLSGPRERHSLLGAIVNVKPNVSREYFREVRSYLRLVADGRERPDTPDLEKLESKVRWILSVNEDRERVLKPLLEAAIERIGTSS